MAVNTFVLVTCILKKSNNLLVYLTFCAKTKYTTYMITCLCAKMVIIWRNFNSKAKKVTEITLAKKKNL